MPFLRPSLTALRQQADNDLATASPSSGGGLLRNSVLKILSLVSANFAHLHYGYLDWISKQAVPATATDEYLAMWSSLRGVTRNLATTASGTVGFSGTNGVAIPVSTLLRTSSGLEYGTTTSATISAGVATASVSAVAAGAASNSGAGVSVAFVASITGVNGTAVLGAVTGGADAEDDESMRSRMLLRYAEPPQGGAITDYVQWALEVPGVTHAWSRPGITLGYVLVYTRVNNALPTGTDGGAMLELRTTPATGDLLTIANFIYPRRPVTAIVVAVAPTAVPIDFVIDDLTTDTPTIRSAISAALEQVFLDNADPLGGTIFQNQFEEAINAVEGVDRYTLTTPIAPVTAASGSIPTLGTVTFS